MLFSETLSPDTHTLIEKIKGQPWLNSYYFAGGTALALHLGHRTSIDLDSFTQSDFEEMTIINYLTSHSLKKNIKIFFVSLTAARTIFSGYLLRNQASGSSCAFSESHTFGVSY
ncbi:MAG: nucleotidyl transferase AbiEii/AbiGii toxin family protein [Deltaproteobacteria bacterium]|nr:nucleotidyl transferase AbiEii/AbiGii toxin family protein [Deltaproteobacteria bacterium]MBW1834870.1 nucleotidyl transferase AbiEii/AbiGii toxin family protein [Deltaproteobacteria bacterium]MBW2167124.1 nucleotidyl transferase AbiEii/AbiGii toxin family protein [Deltaproteobacteria bacterium]